jgi:hypothetical protein
MHVVGNISLWMNFVYLDRSERESGASHPFANINKSAFGCEVVFPSNHTGDRLRGR